MAELTRTQQTEVKREVNKQLKEKQKDLEKKIEQKLHKKLLRKSKKTAVFFGSEFKKHTATALMAAFGFIIALVWRDLIVNVIQENTKAAILESYPYIAQLYTAIIVTIVAVIGIALITRWQKKDEEKQQKEGKK